MQTPHDLNVERLERVSSWLDEVHAGMNTVVHNVHPVDLVLRLQVGIEPLLDIFDNWPPRIVIVHKVAEAGCVNHCQSESDSILFDVGAD